MEEEGCALWAVGCEKKLSTFANRMDPSGPVPGNVCKVHPKFRGAKHMRGGETLRAKIFPEEWTNNGAGVTWQNDAAQKKQYTKDPSVCPLVYLAPLPPFFYK